MTDDVPADLLPPCDLDAGERLAAQLRALAHPVRMTVLRTLAERQACVCGEIVRVLPLAQSTVSQHIKVLADAGLVRGSVEGPRSCYCIDSDAIRALRDELDALFAALAPLNRPPDGAPDKS